MSDRIASLAARILVTAIVSAAAPGAARGALDAAIELGLGHGGWVPEGGELPPIYADHAKPTRDVGLAARLNVQDSDGTLIVSFEHEPTGRAKFVANACKQQRKPAKHLVLTAGERTRIPDAVRKAVLAWITEAHVSVLHVAGPLESDEPGLQQATRDAIVWLLEDALLEPVDCKGESLDLEEPCEHVPGSCCECGAHLCIDCGSPLDLPADAELKTAVRRCRKHQHLDPGPAETGPAGASRQFGWMGVGPGEEP